MKAWENRHNNHERFEWFLRLLIRGKIHLIGLKECKVLVCILISSSAGISILNFFRAETLDCKTKNRKTRNIASFLTFCRINCTKFESRYICFIWKKKNLKIFFCLRERFRSTKSNHISSRWFSQGEIS